MFFRRVKAHTPSFEERIANLKTFGLNTEREPGGGVRVSRNGIAAIVTDIPGDRPDVAKAGLIMGKEIGVLVNAGYQQFWVTPTGRRAPALADQLKELHAFEEDLKEGLGLASLYNTSLGTISSLHLYDRVEERDAPVHVPRPWEQKHPVAQS